MADLKAEQIMAAALTAVTGLTATGSNVARDRDYPTDQDYSLSVEQGADNIVTEQTNAFIDMMLDVSVIAFVKQTNTYSTVINQIRKEVYIAVMANNRNLGLPAFVMDVTPTGADKPELATGADKPIMRMAINFQVFYRHAITDASA